MPKTFSQVIAECAEQNPTLIEEICKPLRMSQQAGIDNATKMVDNLVRDDIRTKEEGDALKAAILCIAENKPGNLNAGIEPDYYSPALFPVDGSDISKKCGLKRR